MHQTFVLLRRLPWYCCNMGIHKILNIQFVSPLFLNKKLFLSKIPCFNVLFFFKRMTDHVEHFCNQRTKLGLILMSAKMWRWVCRIELRLHF